MSQFCRRFRYCNSVPSEPAVLYHKHYQQYIHLHYYIVVSTKMKISFLSIAALASYSSSRSVDATATTCPTNQYPEISSEDEYGRPYLDGSCHTSGEIYKKHMSVYHLCLFHMYLTFLFLCTSYALFLSICNT